jgi:nitrogen PTS system EIIA component
MDLEIGEVAELLNVDERAIQEMALGGSLPFYQMNGQLRFNRTEIEAWVMSREGNGGNLRGNRGGVHQFNLYRAIHRGGVLKDLPGESKEEVIYTAMVDVARRFDLDSAVLTDLLLDREALMPTGLGEGIAVPHARDFLLSMPFDVVTVVFPKEPLEYGALDGKPVHTLFVLLACQDRRHLNLLAKIAHLAIDPIWREQLKRKPSQPDLLEAIKKWEETLARPKSKQLPLEARG